MANNLRALRESRSWSQDQAAQALETTRNQYAKLEGGSRRLSDVWIARAAAAYGVDAGDVVTDRRALVPVVGFVGAGSEAHFYGESQGPLGDAPAPDGSTAQTIAVEVRGDSLGSFFDGWLVFYDDVRSPITDDLIGRLCVVGLEDGRVLIKMIMRSKGNRELFDLHGQFGEPILDAAVTWAAPVKSFVPR
jgi:transcriptional regulator with XRE-family HTH domain